MASLNTKLPITELKAILEAMNFFAKVSVGKVEDLVTETTLPSISITLDSDINENNGQMRTDGGEYNRILIITLQIHLDQTNEDDLYYLDENNFNLSKKNNIQEDLISLINIDEIVDASLVKNKDVFKNKISLDPNGQKKKEALGNG